MTAHLIISLLPPPHETFSLQDEAHLLSSSVLPKSQLGTKLQQRKVVPKQILIRSTTVGKKRVNWLLNCIGYAVNKLSLCTVHLHTTVSNIMLFI